MPRPPPWYAGCHIMTMHGGKDETTIAVPGECVRYVLGCSSTVNVPLCRNSRNSAAHVMRALMRLYRGCLEVAFQGFWWCPAHTSTHIKVTGMMGPNRGSCSEHPRRMRSSHKLPNGRVCCAKSTVRPYPISMGPVTWGRCF